MGYCKRCFDHISNDCLLTNKICVFCYRKIKKWETNGKVITKKDALQNWERSFLVWRNYYLQYYKDIKRAIKNSPKGVFRLRKIKCHKYYYLVYRDGDKVKHKYYGKTVPADLLRKIKLRQQLIRKLAKIKALLYSLRIAERPSEKINNYYIFKRDNFTCQYCGRNPKDGVKLHVDHILPLTKGGGNSANNLITACQTCNLEKHDR